MYYAGIGARETPIEMQNLLSQICENLARQGYVLRSGAAPGSDQACERGCDAASGQKEIFLPWKGFENNPSPFYLPWDIPQDLAAIASKLYPNWERASQGVRKMHARNVRQILGMYPSISEPSSFVLCWTDRPRSSIGGTMFGIILAEQNNIPVFNLCEEGALTNFRRFLNEIQ